MVDYISNAAELRRKIQRFAFTAAEASDEQLADKLQTIPGTEADVICDAAELLYAYRDKLDDEGLRLMAEVWRHGNEQNWTTFAGGPKGSDNRAEQIIEYAARTLGDKRGKPAEPDAMPEPQTSRRADGIDWRLPDGAATDDGE